MTSHPPYLSSALSLPFPTFLFRETCVLRPLFIKYMIFKLQVYKIWKVIINGQNNMRIVHSMLSQFYLPKLSSMSVASTAKWPPCQTYIKKKNCETCQLYKKPPDSKKNWKKKPILCLNWKKLPNLIVLHP